MKAIRTIDSGQMTITPIKIDTPTPDWFLLQAGEIKWKLLAFADDGLIWGRIENGKLALSGDNFPKFSPKLRSETLQEARLFNEDREIHLWRTDDGWQARHISDGAGNNTNYYDETQILWGNTFQNEKEGFTAVSDGSLGFRHAVPIMVNKANFGNDKNKRRPLRLMVRHYLTQDENGIMAVTLSRLVKVEVK